MSSIYIQLKLVCANVLAAKQLKDNLAAFESMSDLNSSALTAVFAETTDLGTIRVDGIGAKKEVVSFDYQDSAQQGSLTSRQLQAWLELGVTFLHYEFCDSQTDYRLTEYYHGLMEISAKEFKSREVSTEVPDPKKVVTQTKQGADAKVAQAIQRGVDINQIIAGLPLYVHVIRATYPLPLAMAALAKQKVDWRLSISYTHQFIEGFLEFPTAKIVPMLKNLFEAAGQDLPQLLRHEAVWHLLLIMPEAMAWICQQEGVDLNAPVLHGSLTDEPFGRIEPRSLITKEPCNCGSILYHINSVGPALNDELARMVNRITGNFRRSDIDDCIAQLKQHGAIAIPPQQQSMTQRFISYLKDNEDAVGLPELVTQGLSLTTPLPDGEHPLALAAQYPESWDARIFKINELLNAGAEFEFWTNQDGFQRTVLKYVFDAEYRLTNNQTPHHKTAEKFTAAEFIDPVLNLFAYPLQSGLDLRQPFKLYLWQGKNHLHFRGSMLGAITLLLCGRHSELRSWCLPLVRLLLAHGASIDAEIEAVDSSTTTFASYQQLQLTGSWQKVVGSFKKTAKASVLERLKQRQTLEGEDEIDAQVIQLLQTQPS